jgi:hypothetical protein
MGENIDISPKAFFVRNPDPFKRAIIHSFIFVLIVKSSKE